MPCMGAPYLLAVDAQMVRKRVQVGRRLHQLVGAVLLAQLRDDDLLVARVELDHDLRYPVGVEPAPHLQRAPLPTHVSSRLLVHAAPLQSSVTRPSLPRTATGAPGRPAGAPRGARG